jgi:hypothetical protein
MRQSQQRSLARKTKLAQLPGAKSATLPHATHTTEFTGVKKRVTNRHTRRAEYNAHSTITRSQKRWADILLCIQIQQNKHFLLNHKQQNKHTMQTPVRIHLTDTPTTWVEYQAYKSTCQHKHHAFIAAIADAQAARKERQLFQTSMLRDDPEYILSQCIPTVLDLPAPSKGSKSYDFPFQSIDHDDLSVNVTTHWTIQQTDNAIEFVKELKSHAEECAKALQGTVNSSRKLPQPTASASMQPPQNPQFRKMLFEVSDDFFPCPPEPAFAARIFHSPTEEIQAMLNNCEPRLDPLIVRTTCTHSMAIADCLLVALASVRSAKAAMADLMISMGVQVEFDGKPFTLSCFDDFYLYLSEDGDTAIPF